MEAIESTEDGRWIAFRFDNGFVLKIDALNIWKTESDMLEITLPDGRRVVLDDGSIEMLDETEPARAKWWHARLN